MYDFGAHWDCASRRDALRPLAPRRVSPVGMGGKRAGPPEECWGAWGDLARRDQHRRSAPLDAMPVVAEASRTVLETDPPMSVPEGRGELADRREAVDGLEASQAFQPNHFARGALKTPRHARVWPGEETP